MSLRVLGSRTVAEDLTSHLSVGGEYVVAQLLRADWATYGAS